MEVVTRVRRAVLAPHGRTRTLGFPGCELVGAHVSGEADSHGGDVRCETRIQQSGSTAAADACGGGAYLRATEREQIYVTIVYDCLVFI